MIVNPNESSWAGFLRNSDGEIPRWKKILLIILIVHLVFTVLDACVFHGWFASLLINATGPGTLWIDNLEYRIKPRQNEIVMSWTETVMHEGHSILNGAWQEKEEKFTRSIPLAPLPPEFARCYVEVTVDPDAPPFNTVPYDHMRAIPNFREDNVIRTEPETITGTRQRGLPPDMVFHLAVRPEDLRTLSHEFIVTANLGGYQVSRILFPLSGSRNDSRREMLLSRTELRPYYYDLTGKVEEHRRKMPSVGGLFLRIVLMPIAAIPDYVTVILNIFFLHWFLGAWK